MTETDRTALVPVREIIGIAEVFLKSGLFADLKDVNMAAVKIMAGRECQIGPFEALQGINIIQGKLVMDANLQARQLKRTGRYDYRIVTHSDQECEIAFFQDGKQVGVSKFTMADAATAGLLNKGPWKQYPRNMLFSRALSNGIRWYAPDAVSGSVYTAEELGADIPMPIRVDVKTGEVIEGEVEVVPTPQEADAAAPVPQEPASGPEDERREAWNALVLLWPQLAVYEPELKLNCGKRALIELCAQQSVISRPAIKEQSDTEWVRTWAKTADVQDLRQHNEWLTKRLALAQQ